MSGLHEFEYALVLAQVEGAGTAGENEEVVVVGEAVVECGVGFHGDGAFSRDLKGIRTRGKGHLSARSSEEIDGSYGLDLLEAVCENDENGFQGLSSFVNDWQKVRMLCQYSSPPTAATLLCSAFETLRKDLGSGKALNIFSPCRKETTWSMVAMDDERWAGDFLGVRNVPKLVPRQQGYLRHDAEGGEKGRFQNEASYLFCWRRVRRRPATKRSTHNDNMFGLYLRLVYEIGVGGIGRLMASFFGGRSRASPVTGVIVG